MSRKNTRKPTLPVRAEEETQFLQFLHLIVGELVMSRPITDDIVPWIREWIETNAKRFPITETLGSKGEAIPSYTDIVFGLYALLTRSYLDRKQQDVIWQILRHCTNHVFTRFIRLANSRHNPNEDSRARAMEALCELAISGQTQWLSVGTSWQRGSRWRISELIRSGHYDGELVGNSLTHACTQD
ncbi:MAG: hypothetical protein Q8Q20_02905 [bacterium]|nr:hypothetical protein [bacterium]